MRRACCAVFCLILTTPLLAQRPQLPSRDDPLQRRIYGIGLPREAMFIGSWHRLPVRLGNLAIEDVEFQVVEGPVGGFVSPSLDETYDPARPTILFAAGWRPGTYQLEMRQRATNTLLAAVKYEVTRERAGPDGPSQWLQGRTNEPTRGVNGAAWGGGAEGLQPENYAVSPAPPVWRAAVILIDTSSERYSDQEATDTTNLWQDELVDGDANGLSTRRYYEQVSYGKTTIEADFYGPYSLDGTWTDYFRDGEAIYGTNFAGTWFAKPEFHQAVGSAAQDDVDFSVYHSIINVVRTVDGTNRFAWPLASRATYPLPGNAQATTARRPCITMPHDWGVAGSGVGDVGRPIHETLSHESAHNMGLPDLYMPEVVDRNVGGWDLMHRDRDFPYFSIAHRLMLGWLPREWIRAVNYAGFDATLTQPPIPVILKPVANGDPGADKYVGVEVRIGNGHNLYVEYRNAQAGQDGDQVLPTNDRVLLTDVINSELFTPPAARPTILLADPASGAGPVLDDNQTFAENDLSNAVFPSSFELEAVSVGDNTAELWLRYKLLNPDPSIRPWPASSDRPNQSPDILVRNARADADPAWTNCPWMDHNNTIEATIRNDTVNDAPQVTVDFFEKPFTLGCIPGGSVLIGSDTHDVPAGEAVTFSVNWVPQGLGFGDHKCVAVAIRGYQVPDQNIVESTPANNFAQSNYTRFISSWASPPERQLATVTVSNPYPKPTIFLLDGQQSNPLYRTYLEHSYVTLKGGEIRQILVMSEYASEAIAAEHAGTETGEQLRKIRPLWDDQPNHIHLRGWIVDPEDPHVIHPFDGADIEVVQGKATRFEDLKVANDAIAGRVIDRDGKPVPGGLLLATLRNGTGREVKETTLRTKLQRGSFQFRIRERWQTIELSYLPPPGYGAATQVVNAR